MISALIKKFMNKRTNEKKEVWNNQVPKRYKVRLVYFSLSDHVNKYDKIRRFEATRYCSSVFKIPRGFNLQEACKVISFITEMVEAEGIEESSLKSVSFVEKLLGSYGFEEIKKETISNGYSHITSRADSFSPPSYPETIVELGVLDLITYSAKDEYFFSTDLGQRYFEWFLEGVSYQEIKEIYASHKIDIQPYQNKNLC